MTLSIACRKLPLALCQDHRPRRRNSDKLSCLQSQSRSEPIPIKYGRRGSDYDQQSMEMSVAKYKLATWNMYILISTSRLHARKDDLDASNRQEIEEVTAESPTTTPNVKGHQDQDGCNPTDSDSEDDQGNIHRNTSFKQTQSYDYSYDGVFSLDL